MIREQIIKDLIRDKKVLDVGSMGQTAEYSLWKYYAECAPASLTGIDIELVSNESATIFGNDKVIHDVRILAGNMENYEFHETFDCIILGDIIEHVGNQAMLLENCRRHLNQGGKVLITTPNAKWLTVMLRPNRTHVMWHDRYTLARILDITGFRIEFLRYYYGNKKHYPFYLRPLVWRQGIICIATPK